MIRWMLILLSVLGLAGCNLEREIDPTKFEVLLPQSMDYYYGTRMCKRITVQTNGQIKIVTTEDKTVYIPTAAAIIVPR